MAVVTKYIDATSFELATRVYDDADLLIISADGYYSFDGKYREQVNGVLGNIFECDSCSQSVNLLYDVSDNNALCCTPDPATQYFLPTGSTFATATTLFTNPSLTTSAPNGFYKEESASGYKVMFNTALDATLTPCPTCYVAVSLEFDSTANDLCCLTPSLVTRYVLQGETFATASNLYLDNAGTVAPDGFYRIPSASTYRESTSGVLAVAAGCPTCGVACSGSVSTSANSDGLYVATYNTGNTVTDVGAIVIYFNPQSIPDGIRVIYDGNTYNVLSFPGEGLVASQNSNGYTFLGNPNDNCANLPFSGTLTKYVPNATNTGWVTDGTSSVSIATTDDARTANTTLDYAYMVVPKLNATPQNIVVEVAAPCPSTGFNLIVDCPESLPSFNASDAQLDFECASSYPNTFYFARDYSNRGNTSNVYPELYNFVFTDEFGSTALADGFYIMDNNNYIVVSSGIVVQTSVCTIP